MAQDTDPTFHLGLTMAGAISAGAYTAGVLDVLLETLDRHNARFERGKAAGWERDAATLPRHRVVLRVISGTSAGGVSAGLAVAGLIAARREGETADGGQLVDGTPISYTSPCCDDYTYRYEYVLKPLHEVWVEAMALFTPGAMPEEDAGFLTSTDLASTPDVRSLLNSEVIDSAAKNALREIRWNGGEFRFLSKEFDLFLTTTNLQGIPFQIRFASDGEDADVHAMSKHAIVRHFRIGWLGERVHNSPWLQHWNDVGIPLPKPESENIDFDERSSDWSRFKEAAIATGAFPAGLAARPIRAKAREFGRVTGMDDGAEIHGGALPIDLCPIGADADGFKDFRPLAMLDGVTGPEDAVNYVAVDGGVANNEPFEYARYTLRPLLPSAELPGGVVTLNEKYLGRNPREAHLADRAVLMIDPFPEGPTFTELTEEQATELAGMLPALKGLVPALINQARFKPGELIEASSQSVHSRYLIAPSRLESEHEAMTREKAGEKEPVHNNESGAKAIACGSLGGFGGFLDRAFRAHDYMLGRRNCHSFLAQHFEIDAGNPLLTGEGPRATGEMRRVIDPGPEYFHFIRDENGKEHLDRLELPVWPGMSQTPLDQIFAAARARVGYVTSRMVGFERASWFGRVMMGYFWQMPVVGRGLGPFIAEQVGSIIMADLISRNQHHDFRERAPGIPYSPWQRRVLVALAKGGDKPVPLVIDGSDRMLRNAQGKPVGDLLSAAGDPQDESKNRADRLEELRKFLRSLTVARLATKIDATTLKPESYQLTALKPEPLTIARAISGGWRAFTRIVTGRN